MWIAPCMVAQISADIIQRRQRARIDGAVSESKGCSYSDLLSIYKENSYQLVIQIVAICSWKKPKVSHRTRTSPTSTLCNCLVTQKIAKIRESNAKDSRKTVIVQMYYRKEWNCCNTDNWTLNNAATTCYQNWTKLTLLYTKYSINKTSCHLSCLAMVFQISYPSPSPNATTTRKSRVQLTFYLKQIITSYYGWHGSYIGTNTGKKYVQLKM